MEGSFSIIICSNCFSDVGLKLDSFKLGIHHISKCPNCDSFDGRKLDISRVYELATQFFVQGASFKSTYGGAPAIQFNEYHFNKDTLDVPVWLQDDLKLIGQILKVGFFHYGPRLWTLGHVVPLEKLQKKSSRGEIIQRILNEYPKRILPKGTSFYRVRKNPQSPSNIEEYDSPPDSFLGSGRLDSIQFPILYASQDLEACIHECRVTVEDQLYFSSLSLNEDITVLDLSEWIEEKETEFESLSITVHFLFGATDHSYEILRNIAIEAKSAGYKGILYPSYFTHIHAKDETIKNLALFGRPILEGAIKVECINRIMINKIIYDLHFGPVSF